LTKEELLALREACRRDFAQHDWDIGEYRCEALFREWLGEPEPAPRDVAVSASRAEMDALLVDALNEAYERYYKPLTYLSTYLRKKQ
jgi:hypothetical protein